MVRRTITVHPTDIYTAVYYTLTDYETNQMGRKYAELPHTMLIKRYIRVIGLLNRQNGLGKKSYYVTCSVLKGGNHGSLCSFFTGRCCWCVFHMNAAKSSVELLVWHHADDKVYEAYEDWSSSDFDNPIYIINQMKIK